MLHVVLFEQYYRKMQFITCKTSKVKVATQLRNTRAVLKVRVLPFFKNPFLSLKWNQTLYKYQFIHSEFNNYILRIDIIDRHAVSLLWQQRLRRTELFDKYTICRQNQISLNIESIILCI